MAQAFLHCVPSPLVLLMSSWILHVCLSVLSVSRLYMYCQGRKVHQSTFSRLPLLLLLLLEHHGRRAHVVTMTTSVCL